MRTVFIGIISLGLLLSSCNKGASQNKDAVRDAIVEYLKGRSGLDMSGMDMQISSLSFKDTEAEATVMFSAKGSTDATNAMKMKYVLEQKGGKWVVKGRSGTSEHGGAAPGAGSEMPPGHPPATGTPEGKK